MVTQTADFDLKQIILIDGSFGPKETGRLTEAIRRDMTQFEALRDAVSELEDKEHRDELTPAARVRLGVGFYLTGRYESASMMLKMADGSALALFFLAKAQFELKRYDEALKSYDQSQKARYHQDDCILGRAAVYRYRGEPNKSLAELDKLSGAVEQTAEYLYQRGATIAMLRAELEENPDEHIALYERAEKADKDHPGALFGLALENERRGNDAEALELYKRAAASFPVNVGLLFNLGLLYEDMEQYEQAVICYQRILDSFPTNNKARLFLKDARASNEMYFDEEAQRKRDRMGQILNLPVTDFELSVRSRNCLKNMGIMSLGDLCRHSEPELLASKNFGDTSLVEIREMLAMKGLRLGQAATEKPAPEPVEVETLSPDELAMLVRPVTDLNLSVRAKKCMNRLNIQTIGELVKYTADQLLDCKNFGVTSLKEIRERLEIFNIKLRGE